MTVKIERLADIQVQLWPAVLLPKKESTNSQYRGIGRRISVFSQMATGNSLGFSKQQGAIQASLELSAFVLGCAKSISILGDLRMQRSPFKLILSVVLGLLLICCVTAVGQVLKGSISGTVTDPQGAVVANAPGKATNTATGAEITTTTDSAGAFRFNLIPAGTYKVDINAPGFKALTQTNIPVTAGRDAGLGSIKLSVGDVGTTVEVTAETPMIES